MNATRIAVLLLALAGTGAAAQSRDPAADALRHVSADRLAATISFLASDRLAGRAPGTRGGNEAATYLAREFRRAGLRPLGTTFLHPVPLRAWRTDTARSFIALGREPHALRLDDTRRIVLWSGGAQRRIALDTQVVFVGYGIRAPEYQWNDYRSADVRGRIVLALAGEPSADTHAGLFDGDALTYYGRWSHKVEEAARQGAAGVLLIHGNEAVGYDWGVVRSSWGGEVLALADDSAAAPPVMGWITTDAAAQLAQRAGTTLGELIARAEQRDFAALPLLHDVHVRLAGRTRRFASPNVVGVLPGRHRVRRREYVAITAHYDHLGVGAAVAGDGIYNGAYDNASGVALLLELARAFGALPLAPERSLLFIASTAEEAGLLGATHFVQSGVIATDRVVAAINIDGANLWGETEEIGGAGVERSTLGELLATSAAEHGLRAVAERAPEQGYFFRSDHFPFARAGVPAISIEHGLAFRERAPDWGEKVVGDYLARHYHAPSDEFDARFDLRGAVQQVRVVFTLANTLATRPARPEWYPDAMVPAARPRPREHRD